MARRVHVVVRDWRWAVVREGEDLPVSVHDRKDDAVMAGQALAEREGAELIVHGLDGKPQRDGGTGMAAPPPDDGDGGAGRPRAR